MNQNYPVNAFPRRFSQAIKPVYHSQIFEPDPEADAYLRHLQVHPRTQFNRLNSGEVQLIRRMLRAGIPLTSLTEVYNVSYYTIRDINEGRTHRKLPYVRPDLSRLGIELAPIPTQSATNSTQGNTPVCLVHYHFRIEPPSERGILINPEQDKAIQEEVTLEQAVNILRQMLGEGITNARLNVVEVLPDFGMKESVVEPATWSPNAKSEAMEASAALSQDVTTPLPAMPAPNASV